MSDTNIIIDCKSIARWISGDSRYRKTWRMIEVDWPISACVIKHLCKYIEIRFPDCIVLVQQAVRRGLESYDSQWEEGAEDQDRFAAFYSAMLAYVAEQLDNRAPQTKEEIMEEMKQYVVRKLNR